MKISTKTGAYTQAHLEQMEVGDLEDIRDWARDQLALNWENGIDEGDRVEYLELLAGAADDLILKEWEEDQY